MQKPLTPEEENSNTTSEGQDEQDQDHSPSTHSSLAQVLAPVLAQVLAPVLALVLAPVLVRVLALVLVPVLVPVLALVLALVLAPVLALVGLELVPGLWTNLWVAAPHGQVAYLSKLREQEDLEEAWAHELHSCQSTPLS